MAALPGLSLVYTGENGIGEQHLHAAPPFGHSSIEKEWRLLCECASPHSDPHGLQELLGGGVDGDALLQLAEEHGVTGLLAARLQDVNCEGLPVPWREKLRSRMRAQHLFTLGLTAELFRILESFSSFHLEVVLVKGPALSLLAYGDPAMRGYVDLDLFVRHKDILSATRQMIALGFEPSISIEAIESEKIPGEYVFRRPGTQCIIELHTERSFRYYPRALPLGGLFARKRYLALDGREVPVFSLEDDFVMNGIHGAKDFWERLMWVADIAAIVAHHPELDWQRARQYAADVGALRMFFLALQLAEDLLGAPMPAPLAADVARDASVRRLSQQVAAWLPQAGYATPALWKRAAFRMSTGGGGFAGAAYLLRLSLSPTEDDWQKGPENGCSWLWGVLRRPLRLIRKYGSGN
jgi:putative nucleotidyltransferase-like protein